MGYDMEPMLEVFIYETNQILDNIEKVVIDVEDTGSYNNESINEVFRGMHTIKGAAGMMMYDNMSKLAHALEDLFDMLRSDDKVPYDTQVVTDLTLDTIDFLKEEMISVEAKKSVDTDPSTVIGKINNYMRELKGEPKKRGRAKKTQPPKVDNYYISSLSNEDSDVNQIFIHITFVADCVMNNVRAYTLLNALRNLCIDVAHYPDNLLDEDESIMTFIKEKGFFMKVETSEAVKSFKEFIDGYPYVDTFKVKMYEAGDLPDEMGMEAEADSEQTLDQLVITLDEDEEVILEEQVDNDQVQDDGESKEGEGKEVAESKVSDAKARPSSALKMISVNVEKLDKLMDLVGELVVSEAMVTRNNIVQGVMDDALDKNIRQHRKIITDMQDITMSIRMVPLSATFQKMKRIIRDISKSTDKQIELKIIGENTEADKNIIELISDPLMHLIRNSCDHGIETPSERKKKGKAEKGTVTLEAKNSGGDVWIVVKDDGKGLDTDKIYQKALEKNLISPDLPRPADEVLYNYIFKAGFSTKEAVSQFSGRGVGMDVVTQNIEKIGGSISVESIKDEGSTIIIKIPLTLTIIDGMRLRVANREFILPITTIKESFKIDKEDYVVDPSGNEMILVRGETISVLRLYDHYKIPNAVEDIHEGIIIIISDGNKQICVFADELVGEQQVVVKPMPNRISRVDGISGCAILGDGGISLILDMDGLLRII